MTANQIAWYQASEQHRHNVATENLTEQMNQWTHEHYVASDRNGYLQAMAAQAQAQAALTNAATNQFNAYTNRMSVEDQIRYHTGMLEISNRQTDVQQQNADTALMNAETQRDLAHRQMSQMNVESWYKARDIENKRRELDIKQTQMYQNYEIQTGQLGVAIGQLALAETKWNTEKWQSTVRTITGAISDIGRGVGSVLTPSLKYIGTNAKGEPISDNTKFYNSFMEGLE